ncbi:MAG: hypothetical protein K8U57_08270 [Planctomycetes bacterium]|nr:hypothetical protein [Planctomycetota bacterium]
MSHPSPVPKHGKRAFTLMTPPPGNSSSEKFNTKSEMTAQIKPSGSKPFKFEVESK